MSEFNGRGAVGSPRRDYRPSGAGADSGVVAVLKRTVSEYREDNLGDWAAALTYYGLLAVFPALIAIVAIVGVFGDPSTTTRELGEIVGRLGPTSARQTFEGPIKSITEHRSSAGILLIVGIVGAVYSASGYVGAFMRASNVIFETPEGRPFWKLRPLQMGVTLVTLLLLIVVALALVLTGPIVSAVAAPLGISSGAVAVWDIAKWPVLIAFVIAMFTILYYASPNVKMRGLRWVAPGAAFALAHRVRRLRPVRRQLRLLRQDLRHARRRHRVPRVDVADQLGPTPRRPAERGARALCRDRRRATPRGA
jgi:membrane protein